MESTSPSGSPTSELAALRILRRSIERALPGDEALAASCEALLDVLDQADAEAVHAYNHAVFGACPSGFRATPMRNAAPHGRPFRMDGLEDPRPEQAATPGKPRDDGDALF